MLHYVTYNLTPKPSRAKWEIVGAPSAPPEAGLRPPPVAAGDNSGLDRSFAMISGMYGRGEG